MYLSSAQIKGKIKNIAKQNHSDPITLLRIYMMERFLERIAFSKYRDCFIVKGEILVTSMIGISLRSNSARVGCDFAKNPMKFYHFVHLSFFMFL